MMRKNLKGPPTFYESRKTHFWHIFAKMYHFIKVLLPSRQSYKLFVGKEFRLFLVVASISKKKDSLLTCSRKKEKSSREQSSFFFFLQKLALKLMPNHACFYLFILGEVTKAPDTSLFGAQLLAERLELLPFSCYTLFFQSLSESLVQ